MNKLTKWMNERKRSSFILVLIVGAYLYYSIYKMFQGLETLETSYTPVYIFMGVFAVGGTVLFILGLIALIGGHYKEKFELSEDEEAAETDEETEENDEETDKEADDKTDSEEDTEDASE